MGLFSKPARWIKKQTHGGLSMSGLKSTVKGAAKNPLTYAALAPFILPAVGGLAGGLAAGAGKIGGLAAAGAGKLGGIKSVGKFALDHGDLLMAGAGALEGMQDDRRSRDLMNDALAMQRQRQAMAGAAADRIGSMQRPDLSSIYQDPANPYTQGPRIPAVGAMPQMPQMPAPRALPAPRRRLLLSAGGM